MIDVDVIYVVNIKQLTNCVTIPKSVSIYAIIFFPLSKFVSFRVKLLCMAFQIAVEEVIMISRHKSAGFSCLNINSDNPRIPHFKMYFSDIILFTSLYKGWVGGGRVTFERSNVILRVSSNTPLQSYVSPVIQLPCNRLDDVERAI